MVLKGGFFDIVHGGSTRSTEEVQSNYSLTGKQGEVLSQVDPNTIRASLKCKAL